MEVLAAVPDAIVAAAPVLVASALVSLVEAPGAAVQASVTPEIRTGRHERGQRTPADMRT